MTDKPQEIEEVHEDDDDDYTPDFIKKVLENPELQPYGSSGNFGSIFEAFEWNDLGRAKTTHEFILVNEATKLWLNLQRLDRIEKSILINQRRPAVEALFRKSTGVAGGPPGEKYFLDPTFQEQANKGFEAFGFAPDALEGEAYLRAMPTLGVIHRQKAADRKALFHILKEIESRYASRHREKKMAIIKPAPKSSKQKAD
jgi:hypothetical protein